MPNENVVLICRMKIKGDVSTNYVFSWAEQIKMEAEAFGFKVLDLQDKNFEESCVEKMIKLYDPFLIFFSGHGRDYSLLGCDNTDVIIRCKNDHLFQNRIVYALSCYAGSILGKSSFSKGCKCFIGYGDQVLFPTKKNYKGDLSKDPIAEPFMTISNEIVLTLLKGGTPIDAIENSRKKAGELIDYWENREDVNAPTILKYLRPFKDGRIVYAR